MSHWRMFANCMAVLALLAGCGHHAAERGATPGVDVGEAALRGGSAEVALQVANGILATRPTDRTALCVQGDALTSLGRMAEAETSYDAALKSDPGSTRARLGLGRLRLATDPSASEALFLEVLRHDPRSTTALSDLGIARDLQGRHADAQQAYREALAIAPEMIAAQVNLALSLAMSGDGRTASKLIEPLGSAPNANRKIRHDYAAVLGMSGNRSEAERILEPDLSQTEIRQFMDTLAPSAPGRDRLAPPVSPSVANGGVQVQLAASLNEDAAQAEWSQLQERLPDLLVGHQALVTQNERDGHIFWRLRTDGFTDIDAANGFCRRLRDANAACAVIGR